MGFDKTDELTINTIRVLAVRISLLPRLSDAGLSFELFAPPSTSVVFHDAHHHQCRSQPPQNDQLLTGTYFLGRCDCSCQLRSPGCAHVRSPHVPDGCDILRA